MKEQISKERQRLERVTGAVHAIKGFLDHCRARSLSVDEVSLEQVFEINKTKSKGT